MVDFAWCTPHACTQCASDGFSRQSISPTIAVPVNDYTLSSFRCIDSQTELVYILEIDAQADSRMDVERNRLFGTCTCARCEVSMSQAVLMYDMPWPCKVSKLVADRIR